MKVTIDASVAVKWGTKEKDSDKARAALRFLTQMHVPDLFFIECANVLWKKTLRNEVTKKQASQVLETFKTMPLNVVHSSPLISKALDLSFTLQHSVYDCVYLSCVLLTESRLFSDDQKFLIKAREKGFGDFVISLHEFPDL